MGEKLLYRTHLNPHMRKPHAKLFRERCAPESRSRRARAAGAAIHRDKPIDAVVVELAFAFAFASLSFSLSPLSPEEKDAAATRRRPARSPCISVKKCGAANVVNDFAPDVIGNVSHAVHNSVHSGHHGKNTCSPVATRGRSTNSMSGAADAQYRSQASAATIASSAADRSGASFSLPAETPPPPLPPDVDVGGDVGGFRFRFSGGSSTRAFRHRSSAFVVRYVGTSNATDATTSRFRTAARTSSGSVAAIHRIVSA